MNVLRHRHILVAFLIGSFLGFCTPASAGPLDKVRDQKGDRNDSKLEPQRGAAESRTSRLGSRDAARSTDSPSRELPDGVTQPNRQQQANLQELRNSLSVLAGGAAAAEDEIRDLALDLQGMSLQAPDPALTQALAADLADAMADASLSPREMAELTQSVYAVMNSAGLSQAELEVLKDDVEAILTASGVDRSDVNAVLDDLQAIYDASQGPSPKAGRGRLRSRT